jgi:hypothetical protein
VTLSIFSRLQLINLCYFSKPSANRPVYRAIRRQAPRKIVELGVGDGRRAMRMIEIAQRVLPPTDIHYVGLDLFEGRTDTTGPNSSLKEIHQLLRATGVRVQLVPGNPVEGLIRLANSLGKVDLLLMPSDLDSPAAARVWFFVPRMLHENTLVFVDSISADGKHLLRQKTRQEIDNLAAKGFVRRAA